MNDCPTTLEIIASDGSNCQVFCTKVLRELAGKRCVYDGSFQGKAVIVKVFTDFFGWYRCWRERGGLEQLTARGITTAKVITGGKTIHGKHCLIIEKIEPSNDLEYLMHQEKLTADNQEILCRVFSCLGQMHLRGITQHDMHLGNFMLAGSIVYVLDPARMKFYSSPVPLKQSYLNMAELLARLPKAWLPWQENFLLSYCQTRNIPYDSTVRAAIMEALLMIRHRYNVRLLRRISRPNHRLIVIRRKDSCAWFCSRFFSEEEARTLFPEIRQLRSAGQIKALLSHQKYFQDQRGSLTARVAFYRPEGVFRTTFYRIKAHCWGSSGPVFPKYQEWLKAWQNFWNRSSKFPPAAYLEFYDHSEVPNAMLIELEPEKSVVDQPESVYTPQMQ